MTYAKIDFSATSDDIKTFVSLPDSGVLRRFTSDLAPPGASDPAGGGGANLEPLLEVRLIDRAARRLVCSPPPQASARPSSLLRLPRCRRPAAPSRTWSLHLTFPAAPPVRPPLLPLDALASRAEANQPPARCRPADLMPRSCTPSRSPRRVESRQPALVLLGRGHERRAGRRLLEL